MKNLKVRNNRRKIDSSKEDASLSNKKFLFAAWASESRSYATYQVWYSPLNKIFKNILFYDPQKNLYQYGKDSMNERFLELIEKEKPDYVFFWLIYDEFYIETLLKIREISPKTIIINFFGDDDSQFEIFSRYYGLIFDYSLILPQLPNSIYKKEGIKNYFFTLLANLDNYTPLKIEKKYDVTFIGTPKSDRYELIRYLKENNINIKLFGWGWDSYPDLKDVYEGPLSDTDLVKKINESKINLCFTKNYYGVPHVKGRVVEVAACNSFVLVEYSTRYLDLFKEGKEIVMFNSKEDLLEKIKYYLKNEKQREKIAERAYKKIVKNYDFNTELRKYFTQISKKSSFKHRLLPEVKKNQITLAKEDFELSAEELKEKIKNYDYLSFNDGNSDFHSFKEYFQIYSLEKTKKKISCCDYYASSDGLKNYLAFNSFWAFKSLSSDDFQYFQNINQLMVDKNYFLENLEDFRTLFYGKKVDILKEDKTCFISIPLVSINNIKNANYGKMKKAFLMLFVYDLSSKIYQKKLLTSSYFYNLIFSSITHGRWFIIRHLSGSLFNKGKLKTLKKIKEGV